MATIKQNAAKYEKKKVEELEVLDDWSSAWEECKASGRNWGGRGYGGRAAGRMTVQSRDVIVEGCTLTYLGNDLLDRSTLRLLHRHRYGLIGRNGVGKSTLMSRIASRTLPGFPMHLRVSQVSQELPVIEDTEINVVDYIVDNDPERERISCAIELLESENMNLSETYKLEDRMEELSYLYDCLDDEGNLRGRVIKVLQQLGFQDIHRTMAVAKMSGGWLMRVSIAQALVQDPHILLLDEPTNHLDLYGIEWLKAYLTGPLAQEITVLVTSHDRNFLDDVCTDIIRFHQRQLKYYPGNYSSYETTYENKEAHMSRVQEGIDKKRTQLEDTIKRLQSTAAKSTSSSLQGAVSSRKKKLARHGAEKNEKGFRFRVQADSYHGMSSIRLGSRNEVALGAKTGDSRSLMDFIDRPWSMELPVPSQISSLGPIVQVRDISIEYREEVSSNLILKNVIFDIDKKSRIGLVGRNGCGKSTLLKVIEMSGIISEANTHIEPKIIKGNITRNQNIRLAYYQQYQQDALPYDLSPLEYLQEYSASIENTSGKHGFIEKELRSHLGAFGISGDLALRSIGFLSGGQKTRVVLAQLTITHPHLLLLDEPTNNLDLDGIRALSEAISDFEGACIIASHDMAFLKSCCSTFYAITKLGECILMEDLDDYIQAVKMSIQKKMKVS